MDIKFLSEFNESLQHPKQRNSKKFLKNLVFNSDRSFYYKRVALETLLTVLSYQDLDDEIAALIDNFDDFDEQGQIRELIKKHQDVPSGPELLSSGRQLWKTGSLKPAVRIFKKILSDEEVPNQDKLTVIHTVINDCYEPKQKEAITDLVEEIYTFLCDKCYFHNDHANRQLPNQISYSTIKDIIGTLFRIRSRKLQERNMEVFKEQTAEWTESERPDDLQKPLLWIIDTIDVARPAEVDKLWEYLSTWVTEAQFHPDLTVRSKLTVQIYASEHLMRSYRPVEQNIATEFLLDTAENVEYSTFIRGDALDVLLRNSTAPEYRGRVGAVSQALRTVREDTVENVALQARELGQQYILLNQRFGDAVAGTTFNNSQNVHTTEINEAIKDSLLSMTKDPEVRGNTIYKVVEDIKEMIDHIDFEEGKCRLAKQALKRYVEDPAVFTEQQLKLSAVLVMVWNRIIQHLEHHELYKRLVEELSEAYNTCATGHLSRVVSVLAGYFEDIKQFASFEVQLKNNIKARVNAAIKAAPQEQQGDLFIGLAKRACYEHKVLEAFLERRRAGIYDELLGEFTPKYLSAESFELVFETVWGEY